MVLIDTLAVFDDDNVEDANGLLGNVCFYKHWACIGNGQCHF